MKRLPIGTQAFEKLRRNNAVYVDKTEHVYNLINNGSVYFLSRPR
ncbi:MAG: AAA family ATPase, partial [Endomicrobium sp.]|nr:AAA family ATPase [Endomicrobium sp.]